MSQIHQVGLDHFLQNQHEVSWTAAGLESEQRQKREFEALLRGVVQEQRIELVAEEGTLDNACLGVQACTRAWHESAKAPAKVVLICEYSFTGATGFVGFCYER